MIKFKSQIQRHLFLFKTQFLVSYFFKMHLQVSQTPFFLQVLTLTKRIVPTTPITMPSVTFCTPSPYLAQIFQSSVFRARNLTRVKMTGELFKPNLAIGNTTCTRFNNFFEDKGLGALFSTNNMDSKFIFDLNETAFANFWIDLFISDNYLNDMDWSEFITTVNPRNAVSNFMYVNLNKARETQLGEPYNQCVEISDESYRKRNCRLQCQNRLFVNKYNCTLVNYYSVVGYAYCDRTR